MGLALSLMTLGVLIHLLTSLRKAQKKVTFDWKIFISKNWVSVLLNEITGITIIIGLYAYNVSQLFEFNNVDITGIAFAVIGFASQRIWDLLVKEVTEKFNISK